MNTPAPLLAVERLVKHFRLPRESLLSPPRVLEALRGVSLNVQAGRSFGIVGESGSGKSTLARCVMALEAPTSGSVRLEGRDLYALQADALRSARRDFQMVFQDPFGSLDPRQSVARIVAEPLAALAAPHTPSRSEQRERVAQALDAVGLRHLHRGTRPGPQVGVVGVAHRDLLGFRDTQQHADHPHRHLLAEVVDEVESSRTHQGIQAPPGELADLRFQRQHLARGEHPGQQVAVDVVDRRILEDQRAGRDLHTGLDDLEQCAATGDEGLVVDDRLVDVLEPAERVEVVLLVVVERRLFADAGEHRVGIHVQLDAVRIVVQLGFGRSGHDVRSGTSSTASKAPCC